MRAELAGCKTCGRLFPAIEVTHCTTSKCLGAGYCAECFPNHPCEKEKRGHQ